MAEKNEDPTNPSDPSATHESDGREPTGDELLNEHPGHDAGERELDEPEAEEPDQPDDPDEGTALANARGSRRPVRRSAPDAGSTAVSATGSSRPKRRAKADDSADDEAEEQQTDGKRVAKKDRPTPKQRSTGDERERTSPARFVRESASELRKVVWPTGEQMRGYFIVVLVFVLVIIAYVSLLDLGYGWALLKLLG